MIYVLKLTSNVVATDQLHKRQMRQEARACADQPASEAGLTVLDAENEHQRDIDYKLHDGQAIAGQADGLAVHH